ncbi:MAG: hypothetical protein NXH75_09995, partial [Halobacteriovoraceae bacterium]|nr:hypothetical protein [Halobacteriovoraceae bacterium]
MLVKSITLVTLAIFLTSCASNPFKLTDEGRKVEVLKRKPKRGDSDCEVVGKISATHEEGSTDLAQNKARNMVADQGADSIFFDDIIKNGKSRKVMAIGYK